MYYNDITKKVTEYPFRVKTEEEFIRDYDQDWRDIGELDWVIGMDEYLGQDKKGRYHFSDGCLIPNKKMNFFNKPKQLVYEKLGEKILIIYKSESVEKVDELKDYLEDKIKQDFSNHWDEYVCITSTLAYSFNSSEPNSDDVERSWEELGYSIVKCSTLEEVKNKIEFNFDSKTAYNKPRQLVYEKLEEKYAIVYMCSTNENTNKLINYLNIRGLNTDDLDINLLDDYNFIIIRSSNTGSGNTIIYPIINPRMPIDLAILSLERNDFVVYDCYDLNSVMKLMGGEIFVDYNKPRQLVYEKLEDTNYAIIYVCGTIEDTIKLIKYLRNRGYSTEQLDENLVSEYYFIIIKKDGVSGRPNIYPIKNPRASLDRITSSLEKDNFGVYECFYLDDVMEMMNGQLFIDYNKPKELVYEKLENNNIIIYKCVNERDTLNLINYLRVKNYDLSQIDVNDVSKYKFIIMRNGLNNVMTYPINVDMGINFVVSSIERGGSIPNVCFNLNDVSKVLGHLKIVDYNKPKQLVYEKKILSFKKFNDK